jgi:hypothetical protein
MTTAAHSSTQGGSLERVGVAEAVGALRVELSEAIAAAAGESLRFRVGEVTVELEVAVERVGGARGGLRFWVIDVGGEVSRTTTRTHRLTVPLTPVAGDGSPVMTGEQSLPD